MVAKLRSQARRSVSIALGVAVLWMAGMGLYAVLGPGLTSEFGSHLVGGLLMFTCIIAAPIFLVLVTLNWVLRRIAGTLVTLLFVGMVRGGLSQGFGPAGDIGIILVSAVLVGSMLYFLSQPPVLAATADHYNFLSPRDVFSRYIIRRKRLPN